MIKVNYQLLDAVLDFRTALDNPVLVHPEDTWKANCPVGADNKRNLCAHEVIEDGEVDKILAECDVVIDQTTHTKAVQQDMMEPFVTYCSIDTYGRLNVLSSTQIVFHAAALLQMRCISPKLWYAWLNRVSVAASALSRAV